MISVGSTAHNIIKAIGRQLDKDVYPTIKNRGIVVQHTPNIKTSNSTYEVKYETSEGQRRSTTGSRHGATRWERASGKPGTTNPTTPVIKSDICEKYILQIDDINTAYPEPIIHYRNDGFWILTKSELLIDLPVWVGFITAVPYSNKHFPRSWGYWYGTEWIGPRHTNFPDGSICSFDINDRTWMPGDSLVGLIDLHTLWAFRQLHLQIMGKWPGRQSVHLPYERILEFKSSELCGCGSNKNKSYAECCQDKDKSLNKLAAAISFSVKTQGGIRRPPEFIDKFLYQADELPSIQSLLFH